MEYLRDDRDRNWLSWPRHWAKSPRIIIAHEPGSALGPEEHSLEAEEKSRVLPEPNRREAQLYQHSYGGVAIRHVLLTVAPPLLTQEGGTRGVKLEIEDARLKNAVSAEMKAKIRYVKPTYESGLDHLDICERDEVEETLADKKDLELSVSAEEQRTAQDSTLHVLEPASRGAPNRLVLYGQIAIGGSHCHRAFVWVAVDVTATVELAGGAKLSVKRTVMLPVVKTTGTTLVTPGIYATPPDLHAAAPGWDHDANPPGYGVNGGSSIKELLQVLFAATKAERCGEGCIRMPPSVLEETESCWFRGDELASRKRRTEFENCLERTRRLALIAPSQKEIEAVGPGLIDGLVKAGKLNVLVAAPQYQDDFSPPGWAPKVLPIGETRNEPRVHLVLSLRDSLRIKSGSESSLKQQRHFIHAIAEFGGIGPSKEDPRKFTATSNPIQCIPGERFSDDGGLAWFSDPSTEVPVQTPNIETPPPSWASLGASRGSTRPHPSRRLKGVLRVEKPKMRPRSIRERRRRGAYANNLICNSPIVRLIGMIEELKKRGMAGASNVYVPRTVITILAEYDLHARLKGAITYHKGAPSRCLVPGLDDEVSVRLIIQRYFDAEGSVIIVPVDDAEGYRADKEVIKRASGYEPFNLDKVAGEIRGMAANGHVAVLSNVLRADGANTGTVAKEFVDTVHKLWDMPKRKKIFVGAMLGDGFLSDRRDVCLPRLRENGGQVWVDPGCAFEEGDIWASALNRRQVAPERFQLLDSTTDPFVSGIFHSCRKDRGEYEIARSRPHGLGRATALGASPFARDMISSDISYRLNSATETSEVLEEYRVMRRGQCYQQSHGRQAEPAYYNPIIFDPRQSMPLKIHGGLTLLRRFVDLATLESASVTPRIVSVFVDSESGALTVRATGIPNDAWIWDPVVKDRDEVANVLFSAFDRRTGIVEFIVSGDAPYEDILALSLYKRRVSGGGFQETVPEILPVSFKSSPTPAAAVNRVPFHQTEPLDLDGQAIMIFGMLVATFVLFSPLSRRWRLLEDIIVSVIGRGNEDPFAQSSHRAPLFSLEASLTEWGMHPGRPTASRSYGLPAGLRPWRSGDSGRSIRISTLFPIVVPSAGIPPLMPEVKLRIASESAAVVVLIEGSGALASPRARRAPAKFHFAARLGAFIAHAVRLSHGAVELRRIGRDVLGIGGPSDTEAAILSELKEPPTYAPPHAELTTTEPAGRLVFYLCDGLSVNSAHLMRMADELSAEGGQLRVIAIVSPDDGDAVGLRRDPLDGSFDDDSETPPALLLSQRDGRLQAIAATIGRRHASLVTLDTELDTQSFLERISDAELLV